MPNLDDFYAFKNTSSGGSGPGCLGCLGPGAIWVFVILAIIGFIVKLFE